MSQDLSERVLRHALGLAEGLVKSSEAVTELLELSGRRRAVLEGARDRARERASGELQAPEEDRDAGSDAPGPEAPALLASRLLDEAIEELG